MSDRLDTIGDLIRVRASVRISCACGRTVNWPHTRLNAFRPDETIGAAKLRLKCGDCRSTGIVTIAPIVPSRR